MSEQQEAIQTSGFDSAKLAAAIALVIGGLFAYYWFENQAWYLRGAYVVGGVVAALLLAWQTAIGRNTLAFILSSRNEVRKMVWPTREETLQTTLAVIVVVLITGVLMWLLDLALFAALRGITGQGA
ncbi:MAG TPA: preprotein translocase subunit SecE [Gammaproteobacteria bacterium]|nr:preprotein translocase subunit SecE [Gammaproteobacteria bacterium]